MRYMDEHYALAERDVRPIKLVYPRHFLLKCLYQVGKVGGYILLC